MSTLGSSSDMPSSGATTGRASSTGTLDPERGRAHKLGGYDPSAPLLDVTDLPEPDSPTMPSTSPERSV